MVLHPSPHWPLLVNACPSHREEFAGDHFYLDPDGITEHGSILGHQILLMLFSAPNIVMCYVVIRFCILYSLYMIIAYTCHLQGKRGI